MQRDGLELKAQLDGIMSSATPEETFVRLLEAVKSYGFTMCLIGHVGQPTLTREGKTLYFLYYEFPEGWLEVYQSRGYGHIDPILQRALKTKSPYRWADCYEGLTLSQEAMVAEFKANGLNFGINFPMYTDLGVPGLLVCGSETDFKLSFSDKIELELLGRYSFGHIESLLGRPAQIAKITLSEREQDILTLVAQGKTNWEIGSILGLSEYSVRDYLKGLSKRMQTSNRTHTVTRAIQLGLILP